LNEEQSEYVKAIKTSAENLLVVINDILDISKLDVNKLKIEKTPFNFQNFVRQIEILLGFKAREKGLIFQINVKEGVPEFLLGDHFRLNQVLINVIGNAIKFTEKGSVNMNIAAVPKNKQEYIIEIEVADTGIGIEEKNLKHIFDSFNQENASIARRFGGTGLGLNISKRLTELMGGTLLMHSKKGFGTKVEIHVPMEVSSNPDYLLTQTTDKEIDIAGKRILIVEDNDFNRLLASTILQKSKVIVDIAKDGLEALVACEENEYDLILMDIQMPILDGHEASDLLRVFKVKTPIIGLSAHPSGEEWNICLEHGMND
jgi:CheY-like chemotaxis protein